ncbi:hypothetical protein [Ralstonia phage GP4]|uniref:Uncharacterized protein n=1 Tax=Ralstonia phage GP4 TaxID=2282904 RepID=A0A345GTW1_9CAUD|nr:hypothetical protein KMC52_gp30 [Ralstonia phage GP4]AXG67725.1 hypothetical protein [Ralstonia phage GP4]
MAIQRNRGVVYAGKVGAKMRPRFSSAPSKRVRKFAFKCEGGPMHGHTLYVNGQRGRYVGCGIVKALAWEAAA